MLKKIEQMENQHQRTLNAILELAKELEISKALKTSIKEDLKD